MAWKRSSTSAYKRLKNVRVKYASRPYTSKNLRKSRAAGLKSAPHRGTKRHAKPLVLTVPLARAVDLHTKKRSTPHHSTYISPMQKLVPMASEDHGLFECTPIIVQVGQLVPGTTSTLQPDSTSSREGNSVRIRSWKVTVKIIQRDFLTKYCVPGAVPVDTSSCFDKYDFDIWIGYNKLASNTGDAISMWDATVGPPAHIGYKLNAWRDMQGLYPTSMPLNDPPKASFLTPNSDQMTIIKRKKFTMRAACYGFSGLGAPPVHAAAAMIEMPNGWCRSFNFYIKKNALLKYGQASSVLPTVAPVVYIQYRRNDGGTAFANLFEAQVTSRIIFDDTA